MRGAKSKNKRNIKRRNFLAKESRNKSGAGEHENKEYRVHKGQQRKVKHKPSAH